MQRFSRHSEAENFASEICRPHRSIVTSIVVKTFGLVMIIRRRLLNQRLDRLVDSFQLARLFTHSNALRPELFDRGGNVFHSGMLPPLSDE